MEIDIAAVVNSEDGCSDFHFGLTALRFSDGTSISVGNGDLVVIVGGNNTGKSQSLRDISKTFLAPNQQIAEYKGNVVEKVEFTYTSYPSIVETWLSSQGAFNDASDAQFQSPSRGSRHPRKAALELFGSNVHWTKQLLGALCIDFLDTETRLTIANPAKAISYTKGDPVTHPIQQLYRKTALELEISGYFRDAFGMDVIVNHGDGSEIPLHCGDRPTRDVDHDRVSEEYLDQLSKLPLAHHQGDGIRSFLGTVLRVFVWKPFVTLLDEPEAFLHPPQARYLGALLAKKKPEGCQVIVSTHSGDFLRGVLDANVKNVKIVRLTRDGFKNTPIELKDDELAKLWKDPLLRHSNVLDGLFHDGVVLCEADTDCQFYSAMLEAVVGGQPAIRRPHLLFAHVGGKDRFRTVIPALRALGVPVYVIADFDILSAEHPLRPIVEALGGMWADIEMNFKILAHGMRGRKKELTKDEVRTEIANILDQAGEVLSEPVADKIRGVVKRASPWALAKLSGKSFVPPGDAMLAYKELHVMLRKLGLHVVEVGEMECFNKSVAGHGSKWVNEVMTLNLADDPDLREAREFVSDLWLATTK
ncbi:ATP-dependent nuclease [Paraburkholderia kururiensis]|uniref:ATP-dependent nuclease n=1 Tax=Paraburkholderia kururiensis TaxID=984307 RepID=UPI0009DEC264|nr:AAA family ATPase [Paraburkholderia kururiensis]